MVILPTRETVLGQLRRTGHGVKTAGDQSELTQGSCPDDVLGRFANRWLQKGEGIQAFSSPALLLPAGLSSSPLRLSRI